VSQQLIVAGFPQLVTGFGTENLPAATHTFNGEEITSNENVKLIAKYDDTIAYLHAALRGALERISDLEAKLA
jgi:secreted trypsin-like serine protease